MTDCFVESEPYYLAIGMTHEQYWEDDPWLVQTYKRAHEMKVEMRNQEMWLQGMYNYQAFMTGLANFGNGLSGKHRKKTEHKYMSEPIRIRPLTEKEKRLEQAKTAAKQRAAWLEAERLIEAHERAKQQKAQETKG